MIFYKKRKSNELPKGFSIVEVVLAISLVLVMVLGLATSMSFSVDSATRSNNETIATFLAQEGLEAVRNIRDENISNLTNGTYGISLSGGRWTLVPTSDTSGIFTRQIVITSPDASTIRATVNITWLGKTYTLANDFTTWQAVIDTTVRTGILVYADNSGPDDIMQYRIIDSNGDWGPVTQIPDIVPGISPLLRGLTLYSSPNSNRKILIAKFVLSPTTYIYSTIWNGTSWSAGTLITSYNSITGPEYLSFDGDFINTGDFYLLYNDNTTIPKYRVFNGTSWGAQQNTVNVGGIPNWIKVRARPTTNNIMAVVHDASNDVNTIFWNGGGWGGLVEHTTNTTGGTYDSVDLVWSKTNNSIALLVYPLTGSNNPAVRSWNGSVWSTAVNNVNIGGQPRASKIASSPTNNTNLACFKDSANDINCLTSTTAGTWVATNPIELENSTDTGNQRSFDFEFEANSGELAVIKYNGNPNPNTINSQSFNPLTNNWSGEVVGSVNTSQIETFRARPNPDNDDILFMYGITDQDLYTEIWDGANNQNFTTGGRSLTEHGLFGSTDSDFWFDFAWDSQ